MKMSYSMTCILKLNVPCSVVLSPSEMSSLGNCIHFQDLENGVVCKSGRGYNIKI